MTMVSKPLCVLSLCNPFKDLQTMSKTFNLWQFPLIIHLSSALMNLERAEVCILVGKEVLSEVDLDKEEEAEISTDLKVRMMLIVWMLHLFLYSKIK